MLKLVNREGNVIYSFESVAEIEGYIDPELFQGSKPGYSDKLGEDIPDWETLQRKTKEAWAKGIGVMEKFVEQLKSFAIPQLKDYKIKTFYSQSGESGEVDFERMMAGNPAFYRKTERQSKAAPPEITIVVDTSAPWNVDPIDILWRGAAAVALTHLLEEKGFKVEVWVISGSNLFADQPNTQVMTACCLKRPGDPLDNSTLINTISGWFYRSAIFSLLYTICRKEEKRIHYGLGQAYTATALELDLITVDEFRVYSAGVFTFDGALAVVTGEMVRLASKTEAAQADPA